MLFHALSFYQPQILRLITLAMILTVLYTLFVALSVPPVSAQNWDNYCAAGQQPVFVFGFAKVKQELGDLVGEPLECEHYDTEGNAYQKTTEGLLFYDKAANRISFTSNSTLTDASHTSPTVASLIADYSIAALRADSYGQEGEIEIVRRIGSTASFTRYEIAFLSDGLRISGFMNVPALPQSAVAPTLGGIEGEFPVIIVNHGYIPQESYQLLTYTTKYADTLAAAGFLVIHPNYRNHRGSDDGANPDRKSVV